MQHSYVLAINFQHSVQKKHLCIVKLLLFCDNLNHFIKNLKNEKVSYYFNCQT